MGVCIFGTPFAWLSSSPKKQRDSPKEHNLKAMFHKYVNNALGACSLERWVIQVCIVVHEGFKLWVLPNLPHMKIMWPLRSTHIASLQELWAKSFGKLLFVFFWKHLT
jgi:hypothetical protein